MEELILIEDDKPPSAGWFPAFNADLIAAKKYYFNLLNLNKKQFFYHIKR
ncbi:MAG: hypothetical protein Q7J16_09900 [Candidatus Cloacimonadales bacterium]|nr:hypothetical protein [Candidatus Cloacimonadales bacterium]